MFCRLHPLLGDVDKVRAQTRMPMADDEMRNRAGAVWRTIDGETDTPQRETRAKAHRLYSVGRDIQRALGLKARVTVVQLIVRFLAAVIARSYGLPGYAR